MRSLLPSLVLGLPLLAASAAAQSQSWSSDFAPRGLANSPRDLVAFDDGSGTELYAAGELFAAGDLKDVVVASWNGARWRRVASNVTPVGAVSAGCCVTSLEAFDSGAGPELYAAGYFTAIDGVAAQSIAKHTPQGWVALNPLMSSVSPPVSPSVVVLRSVNLGGAEELYVGYSTAVALPGGAMLGKLAKWDGAQWLGVGAPLEGTVSDVAAFDDGGGEKLYVAGLLLRDASGPANPSGPVVAWDGLAWSVLDGLQFSSVGKLQVFDDGSGPALYAAGSNSLGNVGVSRWRNGAWEQIGASLGGYVFDFALAPTPAGPRLAAVGSFDSLGSATSIGLGLWDGVQWQNIGVSGLLNPSTNVEAFAAVSADLGSGPRLFVGGSFVRADLVSASNVVSWDGAQFEGLGQGAGLHTAATRFTSFAGATYAGGWFVDAPGASRSYLAKWSGAEWSADAPVLAAPVSTLGAFDVGAGERMYVAYDSSQTTAQHLVWDGAQATLLDTPGGFSTIVTSQLVHDSGNGPELYIAGTFQSVAGVTARNIARWNGQTWSAVGSQGPTTAVRALAFHDDGSGGGEQLYAAGAFTIAGGQSALRVARFDGNSWGPVGLGLSATVTALVSHDDGSGPKLYAAGEFAFAPPVAAIGVARWDGVSWGPVGDGLGVQVGGGFGGLATRVNALAVFDDGSGPALIAGGVFTNSGANPILRLARWNGVTWSQFGGGVDGEVVALAALDDALGSSLWVGGWFRTAGGVLSMGVARWGRNCEPLSYCSSGVTSSGCAPTMGAVGRASASHATSFVLNATSLEGARSGHLFYGVNGAIASPWGQSSHLLCVKAPTQRTPTQPTGGLSGSCDGAMTLDWQAFTNANPGALGQPFQVGQDVWTQAYFRDPPSTKTTALSNALRFTICP